jgi:DNA-binding beta-propeller fold protein YncE
MERSIRRQRVAARVYVYLMALLVALGVGDRAGVQKATAQGRSAAVQAPLFEIDPLWPKPLPNHWVLGSLGGIGVDEQDHIWILNRGSRTLAANFKQLEMNPPWAMCCGSAPAVLEFDQAGSLLRHWGGYPGGPGYEWFDQEHGLTIDHKGNVWIGGGAGGDSHILKFTKDGKFLMQVGKKNARLMSGGGRADAAQEPPQRGRGAQAARVYRADSLDMENFGRPAKLVVDPKTNEAFVADGYLNTRVVVMDADTGKFKRIWGAYGNKPDDSVFEKASVTGDQSVTGYDPQAPPAQQYRHAVHCVMVSKDDFVYVCDRQGDRIQVFTKEGKFLKEAWIAKETRDAGSVWDLAFSADPGQTYLYVGDGENELIHILRRDTLEELTAFGDGGRQPGMFYGVHVIAADSKGNLYTAETYEGHRVQRFIYKGLGPVTKRYQGVLWPSSR